mmetsp:Transcript_10604/g.28262  ORF Transcript_10604/g.28262 Transcript_10604/m.28262 type:complete len:259 (-) Transcript_10604:138-914(-)
MSFSRSIACRLQYSFMPRMYSRISGVGSGGSGGGIGGTSSNVSAKSFHRTLMKPPSRGSGSPMPYSRQISLRTLGSILPAKRWPMVARKRFLAIVPELRSFSEPVYSSNASDMSSRIWTACARSSIRCFIIRRGSGTGSGGAGMLSKSMANCFQSTLSCTSGSCGSAPSQPYLIQKSLRSSWLSEPANSTPSVETNRWRSIVPTFLSYPVPAISSRASVMSSILSTATARIFSIAIADSVSRSRCSATSTLERKASDL